MNQTGRVQGLKRRPIKKQYGQFNETFQLFEEIIDLVNKKILSTRPNKKNDHKGQKRIAKMITQPQIVLPLNSVAQNVQDEIEKETKNGRIRLKRQRDWQGLLSQRKEDIFGEYSICFAYQICLQNVEKILPVNDEVHHQHQ